MAIPTSSATTVTGRGRRLLVACALAVTTVPLLSDAASAADYSNPTPIATPLPGVPSGCPTPNGCPSEQASPYPSEIAVSGVTGTVTDLNVTLRDMTYQFKPSDADILLVAPGGKSVMLMSDACGDNSEANENPITDPITLTFDEQAGSLLPTDGRCSSGTFRPVDDDDDADEFSLHGHADDFLPGAPAPPAITQPLSIFNGIDPNGTWSLYVVDDFPNDPDPDGNAGRIAGGWAIAISTTAGSTAGATTATTAPIGTTAGTAATRAATTATTAGRATTATTMPGRSGATAPTGGSRATTTTTTALPHLGGETVRLSAVGSLLVATGLLLFRLGYERRRRAQIYVVHFGR